MRLGAAGMSQLISLLTRVARALRRRHPRTCHHQTAHPPQPPLHHQRVATPPTGTPARPQVRPRGVMTDPQRALLGAPQGMTATGSGISIVPAHGIFLCPLGGARVRHATTVSTWAHHTPSRSRHSLLLPSRSAPLAPLASLARCCCCSWVFVEHRIASFFSGGTHSGHRRDTTSRRPAGRFTGKGDCLLTIDDLENVTIEGPGATLRMWRSDYADPTK